MSSNLEKERKIIQQISKKKTDQINKLKSQNQDVEILESEVKLANETIEELNKHAKKCPELKNDDNYKETVSKFIQFKDTADKKIQEKRVS